MKSLKRLIIFHKVLQTRPLMNGLEACNFIKKRLQLRCFPLNFAKFLRTPILKNICEWVLLRFLKPTSCHQSLSIPPGNIKKWGFRYFQWVYKNTNSAEWVIAPLYESKAIFACVSVDQALISNEKDVKNLKLSDLLSRRVSITLIKIKF